MAAILKIENGGHVGISAIINIVFQTSCYNLFSDVKFIFFRPASTLQSVRIILVSDSFCHCWGGNTVIYIVYGHIDLVAQLTVAWT